MGDGGTPVVVAVGEVQEGIDRYHILDQLEGHIYMKTRIDRTVEG